MLRIDKNKSIWRIAILAMAAVSMMGPWSFELLSVPAEYACSPPNIRLENDFCGTPLLGAVIYSWTFSELVIASEGLVREVSFVDCSRWLLWGLFLILLSLPLVSTLLLIARGDRQRRQVIQVVAWGLAAGVGLLYGVLGASRYPRLFWMQWGIWLYVGSAIVALTLEALLLAAGRRFSQG
jgi:hypothetical protein